MPLSETPPASLSRTALLARVWRDYLSPQKARFGVALICAVVVAATTSLLLGGLNPAVNLLLHVPAPDAVRLPGWLTAHPVTIIPLFFIAAALARFVAQRGLTLSLNHVGNTLVGKIQSQLFSRLVHADLGRLQKSHSGEYLSSVLYDADLVREAASASAVSYLQNLLIAAGAFFAMFHADWTMALSVLVLGPFLSLVMGRYLKLTRKAAKAAMAETSSLSTAIMESLDGIRIVKIANQEAFEEQRVGAVIERRQAHIIKGSNARTMAAPATELLTGLLLAGLLAYVGWRSLHGGHLSRCRHARRTHLARPRHTQRLSDPDRGDEPRLRGGGHRRQRSPFAAQLQTPMAETGSSRAGHVRRHHGDLWHSTKLSRHQCRRRPASLGASGARHTLRRWRISLPGLK